VLAALFAFGLAGGAALRHGQLPGASAAGRPAAAAVGIRGAMQNKARAAVEDVTLTVDDATDFADVEEVEDAAASDEVPEPVAATEAPAEPSVAPADAPSVAPAGAPAVAPQPVVETPKPVEEAPAQPEPEEPEPAPQGVAAIRRQTLKLLESGDNDQAATMGLQLVAAAPGDAFSYLCLGAAYQAMGRIAEAATAYRTCVQFAKVGDVSECRALSGL
jgi:hypothetical protein